MFFNLNAFSKKEKRVLAYISLLYFLFLIFRFLSGNYFLADSYEYLEIAKSINNFTYFENTLDVELTTKRPFIYPFFLSVFINTVASLRSYVNIYCFFKCHPVLSGQVMVSPYFHWCLQANDFVYGDFIVFFVITIDFLNCLLILSLLFDIVGYCN